MKVPKGKIVYVGGKKYRAGDELPEAVAKAAELGKAPASPGPKKPAAGAGEADKPGNG